MPNALINLRVSVKCFRTNGDATTSCKLLRRSVIVTGVKTGFVIRGYTAWVDIRNGIYLLDKIDVFGNLQDDDQLISKANDELQEEVTVPPFVKK